MKISTGLNRTRYCGFLLRALAVSLGALSGFISAPQFALANSCAGPIGCGSMAPSGLCWCDASCSYFRDCCADFLTTCEAPSLQHIEPASAPTAGGTILTLTTQAMFVPGEVVMQVGGQPCPAVPDTGNFGLGPIFECVVPPGAGSVVVSISKTATTYQGTITTQSNELEFAYSPPVVFSMDPTIHEICLQLLQVFRRSRGSQPVNPSLLSAKISGGWAPGPPQLVASRVIRVNKVILKSFATRPPEAAPQRRWW